MNVYENDFVYGRRLLKIAMAAAVIFCIATLLVPNGSSLYLTFFVLTIAAFVLSAVIIYKYCRCPHCGKLIFLGVLSITTCSRCRHDLITGKKVKKSKR